MTDIFIKTHPGDFIWLEYCIRSIEKYVADRAYNAKWKDDEITWNQRKLMPVEKRIEI